MRTKNLTKIDFFFLNSNSFWVITPLSNKEANFSSCSRSLPPPEEEEEEDFGASVFLAGVEVVVVGFGVDWVVVGFVVVGVVFFGSSFVCSKGFH